MRIAIFTETFLPKIDGIVNTICHLLDYLALQEHESILFAPQSGIEKYAQTPVVGLPGFAFPIYPELQLVPPWVPFSQEIDAFEPDLIFLLNPASLGIAGLLYARQYRIPVAASYNTDIPGYTAHWGMGYLRDPLWAYFRWIHNQADLNFAPSHFTLEELRAQGFDRVKVWGRGVDTALFNPAKRSPAWRERLSAGQPEKPLLLYVGRLAPEKRIDLLRPMLAAVPEARLAIVGDGPERERLEMLFADTPTVFTGYLRGQQLAAAYASADVFVFPSANETFGNVVLEALASGLPAVVPCSGGVVDSVQDGENGWLFEPEHVDGLIHAVQTLIQNPKQRLAFGANARLYAESRSWTSVLDKLLGEFEKLLAQKPLSRPPSPEKRLSSWAR